MTTIEEFKDFLTNKIFPEAMMYLDQCKTVNGASILRQHIIDQLNSVDLNWTEQADVHSPCQVYLALVDLIKEQSQAEVKLREELELLEAKKASQEEWFKSIQELSGIDNNLHASVVAQLGENLEKRRFLLKENPIMVKRVQAEILERVKEAKYELYNG